MNIALIGFMGAGKTTTGIALAQMLGLTFVDADAALEARAGRSISQIFAEEGEAAFRQLEAETLRELSTRAGQVIACGGGAILNPENVVCLREAGVLVWLHAPSEVLWQRVAHETHRPLLARPNPREQFETLYQQRLNLYRNAADVTVNAAKSPAQVAAAILAGLAEWSTACGVALPAPLTHAQEKPFGRVLIRLGARTYPVEIGSGNLDAIGDLCKANGISGRAFVITNETVGALYGERVSAGLRQAGMEPYVAIIPDGEQHKNLETAGRLYDAAIGAGVDRKSTVIALGGGVVGDIAGFIAATLLRGIAFVQVPTTLLAQVDASVGGKVAINHPLGKNLIGAFHQPSLVVADVSVLNSLPNRDLQAGLAEVVKYGLIADPDLFTFCELASAQLLARKPDALAHVVRRSCEIKGAVVEADERESDLRAILNFGHTFGHALETATGYDRYTHGEAVAVGMVAAAHLSQLLGHLGHADVRRIVSLLGELGLPTVASDVDHSLLISAMARDKKAEQGRLRFVVLERIGRAAVRSDVPLDLVRAALLRSTETADGAGLHRTRSV